MASDEEEEIVEGEEPAEDEELVDNPLTGQVVGENLSLLCKTGNGLSHAFIRLDLKNKKLTEISVLNCYVHLRYLDLSNNKLSNISAVNALPHLLLLRVDHNMLTSARLGELQYLQVASFSNNQITSTDGIAHPMLETLNLAFNKIQVLNGLSHQNLPSLRILDLHGNQLTSLSDLRIPTLRQLFAGSNQLISVQGLEGFPQLTTLHLRENQITTLDGFTAELESLQYINLRSNKVTELQEIDKLTCLPFLRALSLVDCPIGEVDDYRVEVLVRLRKLERLDKDQFTNDERADAEDIYAQRQTELQQVEDN